MIRKFLTILVICTTGLLINKVNAATLFFEDFSDNSAGWTLDNEWQIGSAMTSAGQWVGSNPDPGLDHTPTSDNGVAGVVIGGNASTNIHPFYYLTSPVINTNVSEDVSFEYWRWLNSDYTPYMQNHIQVFDGGAWQTIWQTAGSPPVTDDAWLLQVFDISSYKNNDMRIRFGFNIGSSGVFTVSSWNVDDVLIETVSPIPLPAAFWLFGTALVGFVGLGKRRTES